MRQANQSNFVVASANAGNPPSINVLWKKVALLLLVILLVMLFVACYFFEKQRQPTPRHKTSIIPPDKKE